MIDAVVIFWTRRFHSHFSLSFYMLGGKIQEMGKFVCLFFLFSSPPQPLGNNSCEQRNFTRRLFNFPEWKKKGRRWWSWWTRPEQVNLKPPTMTQRLQAAHCLLYALPPALVLPTFRMSLKIPFVLQCESNGFPHPSPRVVLLET